MRIEIKLDDYTLTSWTMMQANSVYQVSELTDEMRRLMETSYPEIWIEGEISSLSTPASGHLYFSLKDD